MRTIHFILSGVLLCGLLVGSALADTFQLKDGTAITGDPVSPDARGVIFQIEEGKYSDRTAWDKFSPEALKALAAKLPKAAPFIEPLLEPTEEEKAVEKQKTALVIKTDYDKFSRPAPQSLLKAFFSTGVGLVTLLLLYAANIYAGYEISVFRARPTAVVCGTAALLPFIGPIIFLCMPTLIESKEGIVQEPMREKEQYFSGDTPSESDGPPEAQLDAEPQLPAVQTFARGQFTFNRRFIETKFGGFFSVVRRDADRDMELIFATARGTYTADRISRMGANEVYLHCTKGGASEEVMIPFLEIQEVTLKHRDT